MLSHIRHTLSLLAAGALTLAAGVVLSCGMPDEGIGQDGQEDPGKTEIPVTEVSTLKVMSFNILRGDLQGPDHLWTMRREACLAMIAAQEPMLFGLQECDWTQRRHILGSNDLFDCVGVAVDGRTSGYTDMSSNPIFWRKDIFELQEWGTFWLSDTPEAIGSYTWNYNKARTCTWARFKIRCNGRQIYYFNTHLEAHGGLEPKEKGILLIIERIKEKNPSGQVPVLFGGDLNNAMTSGAPLGPMAEYLEHAPSNCLTTDTGRTFNGFKATGTSVLDHIFYSRGIFKGLKFYVDRKAYEGVTYISDHYPVFCELEFN